jgi:hypothetical protein
MNAQRMTRFGLCILWLAMALARPAGGEPLAREQAPEPLRPWIDWVLRDHADATCPFFDGSSDRSECAWPARLSLDLDERGGRFTQQWRAYRDLWVLLPGDASRWPQDVRVDGKPAVVAPRDGAPAVRLLKGKHEISGSFAWNELPEILPIPPRTGLVALTLDGQAVPLPRRDPLGQLWLRVRTTAAAEEARLDVRVYRRLADEVPVELTTRIELQVSGKNREVLLGRALPEGFVPMRLDSPLPARLEPDGRLRIQARAGSWHLELVARHEGPLAAITIAANDGPWASEEIWVFDAQPDLRLVTVEGVPAIDPQQTQLPAEWKAFPAYPMRAASTMRLVEKRRGDADPAPDQLSLQRIWWLDFAGSGYTIRDEISGRMSRSWRLEMPPPGVLGRVSVGGRDQLITHMQDPNVAGVEIRQGDLHMEADSRLAGGIATIPAVGWRTDFQQVSGILNLPPGWRLFHASGVDAVSSTWVNEWSLLDLFLVLMISMSAWRIWGAVWGGVALFAVGLTYLEPDAPRWLWLALLAGEALLAVLPAGRPRGVVRLYRGVTLVVLVIVAVPFMASQLRAGMYPALEQPGGVVSPFPAVSGGMVAAKTAAVGAPQEMELQHAPQARGKRPYASAPAPMSMGRVSGLGDEYRGVDEKAAISTGPGLPRWQWRTVSLTWRGPVEASQQIRLVLISPRVNFLLALLRVALLAALLSRALRSLRSGAPTLPASALVIFVIASVTAPRPAVADSFPPPELLKKLEESLLERPECFPNCASSPQMRIEATSTLLSLRAEVDAAVDTAVPLPGGARSWTPAKVSLDGAVADAVSLDDSGVAWLALSAGKHQVLLEGALPNADTVEIPLPLKPHHIDAAVAGWTLEGLRDDGLPEDSIRLVREHKREGGEQALEPGSLPPFARLERDLHLGLSWESENVFTRVTPLGTVFSVEVPLLAGESITTGNLRVENGRVFVVLGPSVTQARWRSILKEAPAIEFSAPTGVPWVETWRLDASPLWHVEPRGIPPILVPASPLGRIREWRPWPGESLTLAITRPEWFPGQTLTIDHAALDVSPGRRSTDATLNLEMRSSRGGQHVVTLPLDAELQSVTVNGAQQPIRQDKRSVTLPIAPGAQTIQLSWRAPQGIATRVRSPEVSLAIPSVNADTTIHLSEDRWALAVGGGRLGPAVLYWSLLAVVLLASLALGRASATPLATRHWLLLGIGLTQAPIWVAAVVVGWLLALGWRERHGAALGDNRFNLVQVGLALWTLAALAGLFISIERGLLGPPEMQISGNGSTAELLRWYHDRSGPELPRTWVVSVPLAAYRFAMLAWALWIASALLWWLRWGFAAFGSGGIWRASARVWRLRRKPPTPPAPRS